MGIAHSTPPLDALFDNQTWVKEHASDLFPDNPKKTFEYVKNHHPFCGCAFSISAFPPPHQIPQETDVLAKYADAVTVCCVEILGYGLIELPSNMNLTEVANAAYVAKYHSDAMIRERASKMLENR